MKKYINFLLEHKNNIISDWFYYSDIINIFDQNTITKIKNQIKCENENALCVILSNNNSFLNLNISYSIIKKKLPKNHINNLNNYFVIDIDTSTLLDNNIDINENDILKLIINKESCKTPKPRQQHGFEFEKELCKKFNNYSDANFKLTKNIDKWDAYGKISKEYIQDILKLNKSLNINSKFYDNYNWNIKTVKFGNTISMGDFLRISGLEKVKDFDQQIKNNKTNSKLNLIKKINNNKNDNQFMFCCKSYINNDYIIDFIIINYDYWEKHINNNDNIQILINNIYNELHKHKINAEIIVNEFFKKDLNKINKLEGKDKDNIKITIDKSSKKYKTKLNEILDKLLKNENWTISFDDNDEYNWNDDSSKKNQKEYIKWRNQKDLKWKTFMKNNKEKYHNSIVNNNITNEKNHINLAFKRDSKGHLRLQGSLNNKLFNKIKKENPLLSIDSKYDKLLNINNDINCNNI